MRCLKEINQDFLYNKECQGEILNALGHFSEDMLNMDYECSTTFAMEKDDDTGNSYRLLASKVAPYKDKYYLELSRKGSNEYYVAIMKDHLVIKQNEVSLIPNTRTTVRVDYKKTEHGFKRNVCTSRSYNLTDSEDLINHVLWSNEEHDYVVQDQRAIEVFSEVKHIHTEYNNGEPGNVDENSITCTRNLEQQNRVMVSTKNYDFAVQVEEDSFPSYVSLMTKFVEGDNAKEYIKNKIF